MKINVKERILKENLKIKMNFKGANFRLTADFSEESRKCRRKWDLLSAKRIVKSILNNAVNNTFFQGRNGENFSPTGYFFFKL